MKQTKTTLKELTAAYRAVLRHGILCNAIALGLIATATPAMAATPFLAAENQKLSGTYSDYVNGDATMGGVVAVAHGVTGVSVADETVFSGNKTTKSTGGAVKLLNGATFGDGVKFQGNSAESPAWGGGAMYIRLADKTTPAPTDTVTIGKNSEFSKNSGGLGGAIALEYGKLNIGDGASFTENSATEGGAIMLWHDAEHGDRYSTLTLNSAEFSTNTATSIGGAIVNKDAGDTVNISNSTFTGNTATTDGGAIYNEGTLALTDATFGGENEGDGNTANKGGAIYNTGSMTVTGTALTDNTATKHGGAIYNTAQGLTIENGTISSNKAYTEAASTSTAGGAIYNTGKDVKITGTQILNNTSVNGNGGAIVNTGTGFTVENATISGNKAESLNGSVQSSGGAIQNAGNNFTIKSSTISNNSAYKNGGAINATGSIIIEGSTFGNNTANTGNGGAISGKQLTIKKGADDRKTVFTSNHADSTASKSGLGGAIVISDNATISDAEFNTNTARVGGAIYQNSKSNIYLQISDSSFTGNVAKEAGAVSLFATGDNRITNSTFKENHTTFDGTVGDDTQGGGAVSLGSEAKLTIDGTTFDGNTSTLRGGAIDTRTTAQSNGALKLTIENATFKNNKAGANADGSTSLLAAVHGLGGAIYANAWHDADGNDGVKIANTTFETNSATKGGAIYNDATDGKVGNIKLTDSTFTGNTATANGGAIYNAGTLALAGTNTFTGNNAKNGGAIYNVGTLALAGTNTFTGNTATTNGGAIYATEVTIKDADFTGNTAGSTGGAILSNNAITITGGKFEGNHAAASGVLYDNSLDAYKKGTGTYSVTIDGTEFKDNYAGDFGAVAIFSRGSSVTNAIFTGNRATADYANLGDGAGALFLGSESQTIVSGSTFKDNISGTIGGAIATRPINYWLDTNYSHRGTNSSENGKVDVLSSTFEHNTAGTRGGALFNSFYNSANKAGSAYVYDSTFKTNSADLGGAVYNEGWEDSSHHFANLYIKGSTFEGNTATSGGAVYNGPDATVTLDGSTFTSNTATTNGGAVYNEGIMGVAGENTFSGNTANGVANDIYNAGTLNIASGTTTMDGGIAGTGALTIADGATLNLGTVHVEQGVFTLDGVVNGDLRNADDFLAFNVSNTFDGDGRLNLNLKGVGTYNVFEDKVFNHANVKVTSSSVFDYVWNESYDTITVSTKSANEIAAATGVKTETATTVTSLANSGNETAKQIGQILGEALADGKTDYVEGETKKMAPEDQPVTHSVASTVQNQVLNLAANRMAGPVGRAGGDITSVGYGVWAQGLLNKTKYSGQFDGDSRGFALGFDALINKMYTIGVGYSFSNSDINVHDGRSIDIDSNTVFLYGQYKPTKWFINATLSNTVSSYSENAVVAGVLLKTDYDVNSFGVQTMTGYDFASGITPSLGLRYLHVSTDGYDTLPGYVGDMNSNYMTAVAGAKYTIPTQKIGDVRWAPEVRAALTYDVISDKNGATVYVPGGTSYHIANDRLSRGGGELGMGLTAEWRGLELSLNYDLQLRKDYLSHTGMIKLRYEF